MSSFAEPTELPAAPPRGVAAIQAAAPAASPAMTASPGAAAPASPASPGPMRGPYPTSPGIGETAPNLAGVAAPAGPPPVPVAAATVPSSGARASGAAAGAARAATAGASASGASGGGLGAAMREEVWAIVRAAVEEAMGPVVVSLRELEARVERAERGANAGTAARGAPPPPVPMGVMSSIPVALGPSLAPPAFTAKNIGRVPTFDADPTSPGTSTSPRGAAQPPRGPMLSLPPQGYGVTVMKSTRPTLDLEGVGPVDVAGFDGGRRKRLVAGAVVAIMLMIIVGAVTMTLISQS